MGAWFCGKCGKPNVEDDGFCIGCGAQRRRESLAVAGDDVREVVAVAGEVVSVRSKAARADMRDAKADYYRMRSVKIADDMMQRGRMRDGVNAAGRAAVAVGKGVLWTFGTLFGGIVLIVTIFVFRSKADSDAAQRRQDAIVEDFRAGCRSGKYREVILVKDVTGDWTLAHESDRSSYSGRQIMTCGR